jgi:hypothetical protein
LLRKLAIVRRCHHSPKNGSAIYEGYLDRFHGLNAFALSDFRGQGVAEHFGRRSGGRFKTQFDGDGQLLSASAAARASSSAAGLGAGLIDSVSALTGNGPGVEVLIAHRSGPGTQSAQNAAHILGVGPDELARLPIAAHKSLRRTRLKPAYTSPRPHARATKTAASA